MKGKENDKKRRNETKMMRGKQDDHKEKEAMEKREHFPATTFLPTCYLGHSERSLHYFCFFLVLSFSVCCWLLRNGRFYNYNEKRRGCAMAFHWRFRGNGARSELFTSVATMVSQLLLFHLTKKSSRNTSSCLTAISFVKWYFAYKITEIVNP